METGSAVFIFINIIGICYIIYDSRASKYTKLEESFGGFMNRSQLDLNMKSHHYILLFMVELERVKHILLDNT